MDYKIPFKGLENGKHQYEFTIDDKFFEEFPEGEINRGSLIAKVELNKRTTGIESFFEISGIVKMPCDRCLDDLDCPVEFQGKLFFEFGHESEEVSDELVMLSPSENYLELDIYIYEYIILSLPIQNIHPNDKNGKSLCNAEMLAKLNSMIVNNDDDEIDDPRWDKLRDLIN
jgi:uncharacterized metal-binding protein YceD (DUF177 family)